ncbi:MAG: RNA polymerase sigma factor [Bacteroidota bacterium]|jgi:RNA polymerase sigma factor (sigma-70 family)
MTEQQYNQCVDMYADGLYRFILKNMRDEFEADNIVQNTFEKLWVRRTEVLFEKAKPYLFKIAYNNMIDVIRQNKRWTQIEEGVHDSELPANEYSGLREALNKGLERLPEKQRTVVLLRDYEGYSYEEISEIAGLTIEQVKVYIYRARTALKEFIGKPEVLI